LLALAVEANERAWWYEYADALPPQYMEFIGLEAEVPSVLEWQVAAVPGLLQTEEYARAIHSAHQQVMLMPPGMLDRRVAVRMIRQEVLTARNPPLELSVVIDESVLLRKVGSREVMAAQLRHLAEITQLANVDLRVLPLESETSLRADGFVVFGFGPPLGDVVSTEVAETSLYIQWETDTYIFRLFFGAFVGASLSPEDSRELIQETAHRLWETR
jgi:hypothetical protein